MEKVKLEDILEYEQPTKYIVASEQYKDEYDTPVLTAGKTFILGYTNEKDGIYNASKDNPILLFDDFTTDCRYVDFKFKVKSSAIKILKLKNKNNNIKYLNYLLNSIVYDTTSHKRYWISQFSKFEINLPNVEAQNKIVNELEKIEKLILNKEKQIKKLNELEKSKFNEMFENKNYARMYGKDLFIFSSGKGLEQDKRTKEGIPVYGGNGIAWYTDKALIDYDTIVIGRVGAYCGNVKIIEEPVWITDNAIYIKKFKKDVYDIKFLYNMMNNIDFSRYAQRSGQPKITQDPLKNYLYIVPPKKEQILFSEIVRIIENQRNNCNKTIKKLTEIKKSKIQDYFGGDIND